MGVYIVSGRVAEAEVRRRISSMLDISRGLPNFEGRIIFLSPLSFFFAPKKVMGLEKRTKRLRKVLFRNEWVSSNVELTSALRSDRYLRISEPHQLVLLYARKAVSRQKKL